MFTQSIAELKINNRTNHLKKCNRCESDLKVYFLRDSDTQESTL
jgi:6-phosphogluconolactonase (cycloisomerase 2 family)